MGSVYGESKLPYHWVSTLSPPWEMHARQMPRFMFFDPSYFTNDWSLVKAEEEAVEGNVEIWILYTFYSTMAWDLDREIGR